MNDSRLVWADEFDGPAGAAPSPRWWTAEIGPGDERQLQTYTAPPANAALDGAGRLAIMARREPDGTVTSARLITKGRVAVRYGRVEARIQVPGGARRVACVLDARDRHRRRGLAGVRRDRRDGARRQPAAGGARDAPRPWIRRGRGRDRFGARRRHPAVGRLSRLFDRLDRGPRHVAAGRRAVRDPHPRRRAGPRLAVRSRLLSAAWRSGARGPATTSRTRCSRSRC